uniref:Uncharacterized protein n=1 Tax=Anguilla anguilla TaxID=7936 RepID=A0A0E9VG26_ANGAN
MCFDCTGKTSPTCPDSRREQTSAPGLVTRSVL